eukprot:1161345-Pelagomonas_calceolata.AAC.20
MPRMPFLPPFMCAHVCPWFVPLPSHLHLPPLTGCILLSQAKASLHCQLLTLSSIAPFFPLFQPRPDMRGWRSCYLSQSCAPYISTITCDQLQNLYVIASPLILHLVVFPYPVPKLPLIARLLRAAGPAGGMGPPPDQDLPPPTPQSNPPKTSAGVLGSGDWLESGPASWLGQQLLGRYLMQVQQDRHVALGFLLNVSPAAAAALCDVSAMCWADACLNVNEVSWVRNVWELFAGLFSLVNAFAARVWLRRV